jgi:hypothetical protein
MDDRPDAVFEGAWVNRTAPVTASRIATALRSSGYCTSTVKQLG